jgi:hypothetical protein
MSGKNCKSVSAFFETLEKRTLLSASFLSNLGYPNQITSTVPGNGDVNPYGVAFVPQNIVGGGKLHAGDVLVSNFNNSGNAQGTGTTIVDINSKGKQSVFFQGPTGLGLTTALGVLPEGFVLVGNAPTGGGSTINGPGSLIILDKNGHVVDTLKSSVFLDGPWDLAIDQHGSIADVFVSNVVNGTVSRLVLSIPSSGDNIKVLSEAIIGTGYGVAPNAAALVVGPTGLAFDDATDTLYVASTDDNAIYSIANAEKTPFHTGKGKLVFANSHLRGPLALAFAPNGDLLTANGDAVNADPLNIANSEIVEFTTTGKYVTEYQINPNAGGAFGLAVETIGDEVLFAAVNDVTNQLEIWKFDM